MAESWLISAGEDHEELMKNLVVDSNGRIKETSEGKMVEHEGFDLCKA